MPDILNRFIANYGTVLLTAIIVFIATWFWRSRDRRIIKRDKKKDRKGVASREENLELAHTVEALRDKTAESVEEVRIQRSQVLEVGHDALVQEIKELRLELQKIKEEQIVINTKMLPMWAAVQARLIKDLTHPHPQFKSMDKLLQKLGNLEITESERIKLDMLLDERMVSDDPEISSDEKDSASIMKAVMRKVLQETILFDDKQQQ